MVLLLKTEVAEKIKTWMNKTILITGFEPFDGDAINPSLELLSWLHQFQFEFNFYTEVLPVSFHSSILRLDEAMKKRRPTHVLLTGYAKNRSELTIERIGINCIDARIPDNDGHCPKNQKIISKGEDGLFSTLPLDHLLTFASEVGCPTKISSSAGEYVCNYILYYYLYHYREVPGTFLHLPASKSHEIFFQGIKSIIEKL